MDGQCELVSTIKGHAVIVNVLCVQGRNNGMCGAISGSATTNYTSLTCYIIGQFRTISGFTTPSLLTSVNGAPLDKSLSSWIWR